MILTWNTKSYRPTAGVQFRSSLQESNLIATITITIGSNEGSWFLYVAATRIITGIDSLILGEFAALYLTAASGQLKLQSEMQQQKN